MVDFTFYNGIRISIILYFAYVCVAVCRLVIVSMLLRDCMYVYVCVDSSITA